MRRSSKPLKRTSLKKISPKKIEANKEKAEARKERNEWLLKLWDSQEVDGYIICFECGGKIPRSLRTNSCCYSHILDKFSYPELALEEFNVKIVHPECHDQFEKNPVMARKQYELSEKLKYDRSFK